jgi:hypothetical protein
LLGEWEKNRFQIFRSLTLLRQLSLHAGLVDESKVDVGSAKIDFLVDQLPELVARGTVRWFSASSLGSWAYCGRIWTR